jgi:mRNA interferase RelE/StbE
MALRIPIKVVKAIARRRIPREVWKRLQEQMEAIARDPHGHQANVERYKSGFRVRHGDWRAIYEVDRGDVVVIDVGHRREIYR